MVLEVIKETEVGDEPVSSFAVDICESLQNEDAPWANVVREMKLTGCPIELVNLIISYAFFVSNFKVYQQRPPKSKKIIRFL